MWKWIGGCFVLCIVIIGVAAFWGFRKVKGLMDEPSVASVTIGASPERVFASLANADSIPTWMATKPRIGHSGMLVVGDTFALGDSPVGANKGQQSILWTVTEIKAPHLIAYRIRMDSAGTGTEFATLRDSLVARGDSTEVIATFAMPDSMSITTAAGEKKAPPAALQSMFKLMLVGFTQMEKAQLTQLKERIEGKPVEAKPADTTPNTPDSASKKKGG
jgi:uncharacterized protein YndB with AHSA1/START domain